MLLLLHSLMRHNYDTEYGKVKVILLFDGKQYAGRVVFPSGKTVTIPAFSYSFVQNYSEATAFVAHNLRRLIDGRILQDEARLS